jgi:hypothetical protein
MTAWYMYLVCTYIPCMKSTSIVVCTFTVLCSIIWSSFKYCEICRNKRLLHVLSGWLLAGLHNPGYSVANVRRASSYWEPVLYILNLSPNHPSPWKKGYIVGSASPYGLLFNVLFNNVSLIWDAPLPMKGCKILSLCSALRAFELGGIFIVQHLLWHGSSVFPKDRPIQSPLVTHGGCRGSILTWILTGPPTEMWLYRSIFSKKHEIDTLSFKDIQKVRFFTVSIRWFSL